ncbi:MAG TPA: VCBS repeat-containing protein [Acidobacteriaceae bacterium]|nr:VCBS repeat-containing protein [Acidobacteriaceae bacterium]
MSRPRVLAASALLCAAAAFTSITSAQTTFNPRYTAFSEDPSFTEPPPLELLQADLNGDGVPDFIAAQGNQELLSNSSGGYTLHHFSSSALEGGDMPLVAGDFNGDGKNDVLFYAYTGGSNLFVIGYGDGAGNYPTTKTIPNLPGIVTGEFSEVVAQATDVNGDGRPDLILANLVVSNPSNPIVNVRLYLNNGSGFTDQGNIYSGAPSQNTNGYSVGIQLLLGDYDSDGHADIALVDGNLIVLYGDGRGHFTTKAVDTGSPTLAFAAADMNEDGRTDLVGVDVDQTIHVFLSQAGRTFSQSAISAPDIAQTAFSFPPILADFDGNGRKDIGFVSASSDYSQYGFNAEYQTGSNTWKLGTFTPVDTFAAYYGMIPFVGFSPGNYNHDQKADVALFTDDSTAANHPNSADVLLNTGGKAIGSCAAPAIGIHVCSPGTSSASPVKFSFSATSFYPVRKMEVWVDGVKKSETYHVVGNQGFADVSLALSAGTHQVSFFSGGFDGSVQKKTVTLKVP